MRSDAAWSVLALVSLTASLAGACSSSISKRPGRPTHPSAAPRPAPPPSTTPPPRTNVTFPTFRCESPYSEYYCLNDAKCFMVVIEQSPIYNCECRDGFVGQRCEYKNLEHSYVLMSRRLMMETASIAGGATVAVFLAILVCLGAWVRLQRRGKEPCSEAELRCSGVQLVAVASGGGAVSLPARPPPAPARTLCATRVNI